MKRVSAADVVRNFSSLSDEALREPIVVTRNGRDRLVVVSVAYFQQILSQALVGSGQEDESMRFGDLLKKLG